MQMSSSEVLLLMAYYYTLNLKHFTNEKKTSMRYGCIFISIIR